MNNDYLSDVSLRAQRELRMSRQWFDLARVVAQSLQQRIWESQVRAVANSIKEQADGETRDGSQPEQMRGLGFWQPELVFPFHREKSS